MTFALIRNALVHEVFEADPGLGDAFDVRDVSNVNGVAVGWLLDANGTLKAPATFKPATVIPAVSRAQAKLQLHRTPGSADGKTLLDDVIQAVDLAGGEVAIWFTEATTWERDNPNVLAIGTVLKIPSEQIDALFVEAAKIAA